MAKRKIDITNPIDGQNPIDTKPIDGKPIDRKPPEADKPKKKEKKERHEVEADIEWVLETTNVIEVDEDEYREFFKDIVRKIKRKVRKVKRQIPNQPFRKHGYIAFPKKRYDAFFDRNGNPKKNLKVWEADLATRRWEDLRQNDTGTRAIFETWWYQQDIDEFLADTKNDPQVSSSYQYMTAEDDGIDKWKEAELSKPEWNPKEG